MKIKKILSIVAVLVFFASAMVGSGEPAPGASERQVVLWNVASIAVCIVSALAAYWLNRDEIRKAL